MAKDDHRWFNPHHLLQHAVFPHHLRRCTITVVLYIYRCFLKVYVHPEFPCEPLLHGGGRRTGLRGNHLQFNYDGK